MLTLAAETATLRASLALLRDGEPVSERSYEVPPGHGAALLSEAVAMLRGASLSLADVDLFAVSSGPGSFTGLRVGLASFRALAWALGKPIVAVPSLHTLAEAVHRDGLIATALDARKKEVYGALFRRDIGALAEVLPPATFRPEAFRRACLDAAAGGPVMVVGTGVIEYRDALLGAPPVIETPDDTELHFPKARTAAMLAERALAGGAPGGLADAMPAYVRRSEAEVNLAALQSLAPGK